MGYKTIAASKASKFFFPVPHALMTFWGRPTLVANEINKNLSNRPEVWGQEGSLVWRQIMDIFGAARCCQTGTCMTYAVLYKQRVELTELDIKICF